MKTYAHINDCYMLLDVARRMLSANKNDRYLRLVAAMCQGFVGAYPEWRKHTTVKHLDELEDMNVVLDAAKPLEGELTEDELLANIACCVSHGIVNRCDDPKFDSLLLNVGARLLTAIVNQKLKEQPEFYEELKKSPGFADNPLIQIIVAARRLRHA